MKIGIGVATRGRPILLARLLNSFLYLHPPPPAGRICFIIVENETAGTDAVESAVEQFKFQLRASNLKASPVSFSVEPKLGIPFARNHVLDVAARIGCDFLAFTDDDCRVSPDWITRLLEAQQKDDADLTTNHVHLAVDFNGLRYAQKMLAQGELHGQARLREKSTS